MGAFHPWRKLRERADILVHWVELPARYAGLTDGKNIWLNKGRSHIEARCTLAHELAHIALGHSTATSPLEEELASHLAAIWLIDIEDLAYVALWAHNLETAAERLLVTPSVLQTRIDNLHPSEHAYLARRNAEREDALSAHEREALALEGHWWRQHQTKAEATRS